MLAIRTKLNEKTEKIFIALCRKRNSTRTGLVVHLINEHIAKLDNGYKDKLISLYENMTLEQRKNPMSDVFIGGNKRKEK